MIDQPEKRCRTIEDRLSAYLDGELSARDRAEVEEHLRACRRCGSTLEDLRSVIRSVRSVPAPAVPAGLQDRLLDRVAAEEPPAAARPNPPWLRLAAAGIAACFLIVLALHLGGLIGGPRRVPGEVTVAREALPKKGYAETDKGAGLEAEGIADEMGDPRDLPGRGRKPSADTREMVDALLQEGARPANGRLEAAPAPSLERSGPAKTALPAAPPDLDMANFKKFLETAPKEQEIAIGWSGGEDRRSELYRVLGAYVAPAKDTGVVGGGGPAGVERPRGEEKGKKEAEEKIRTEGFFGRDQDRMGLAMEKGTIQIRLNRAQYPLFLLDLDRFEEVELLTQPLREEWPLAKAGAIRYREANLGAPEPPAEGESRLAEHGRGGEGRPAEAGDEEAEEEKGLQRKAEDLGEDGKARRLARTRGVERSAAEKAGGDRTAGEEPEARAKKSNAIEEVIRVRVEIVD